MDKEKEEDVEEEEEDGEGGGGSRGGGVQRPVREVSGIKILVVVTEVMVVVVYWVGESCEEATWGVFLSFCSLGLRYQPTISLSPLHASSSSSLSSLSSTTACGGGGRYGFA